jgi:hypothetical protein
MIALVDGGEAALTYFRDNHVWLGLAVMVVWRTRGFLGWVWRHDGCRGQKRPLYKQAPTTVRLIRWVIRNWIGRGKDGFCQLVIHSARRSLPWPKPAAVLRRSPLRPACCVLLRLTGQHYSRLDSLPLKTLRQGSLRESSRLTPLRRRKGKVYIVCIHAFRSLSANISSTLDPATNSVVQFKKKAHE